MRSSRSTSRPSTARPLSLSIRIPSEESALLAQPDLARQRARVGDDAIAREVAADPLDVALEERVDRRVVARVERLGEVDDRDDARPVEDVVGRQVAVDAVAGEPEFDV